MVLLSSSLTDFILEKPSDINLKVERRGGSKDFQLWSLLCAIQKQLAIPQARRQTKHFQLLMHNQHMVFYSRDCCKPTNSLYHFPSYKNLQMCHTWLDWFHVSLFNLTRLPDYLCQPGEIMNYSSLDFRTVLSSFTHFLLFCHASMWQLIASKTTAYQKQLLDWPF